MADDVKASDIAGRLRSGRKRVASFKDEARFFKTLIESPRLTGAVTPSGRRLAQAMARAVGPARDGLIIELGPGTGPVTKALIESGVAPADLLLVEFDGNFCALLAERFAGVRVVQGDAYALKQTLAGHLQRPVRAIVSSLPLLNQKREVRSLLFDDCFALMRADGVFVQFTYGLTSPIPSGEWTARISARASAPIWRNLPPARVWTYRIDPDAGAPDNLLTRLRGKAMRRPKAPKQ
jgi:phosphatidylethanolamine/phosphatidyl-N-methylethanolamine N-methyltransferase